MLDPVCYMNILSYQIHDIDVRMHPIKVRDIVMDFRVSGGISFTEVLIQPLKFKIPIGSPAVLSQFPGTFVLGEAEYGHSLDVWFEHQLVSLTSEQAVIALDSMWQNVLKRVVMANILMDEHDASSTKLLRPDFTVLYCNALVMKGEAKATYTHMNATENDLIKKFHKAAFKMFPRGCNSIPAVMTCNEAVHLYSISYFNGAFYLSLIKRYDVNVIAGRVEFIVDLFKIIIWIMSQTNPIEGFHLAPGNRTKTRNGHYVTLLETGLLKEFDSNTLHRIKINLMADIYALSLPNVEHGVTNCTSITITRVGSRLRDAIKVRHMNLSDVYMQVEQGVNQLHSNGYAHCDICVDNIFVDSVEDGGGVFIGDLEYCCKKSDKPPKDIRRADKRAKSAEALDSIQLLKFRDELATL
jgi:hypothetical protein